MKSKKSGISVVSVLIIVIVISVLASTVIFSSEYILEYTYKKEFKKEYYLVKSAVNDYIIRNSGNIDFEEIEIDLSDVKNQYLTQFTEEIPVDNKIKAYVVDLEKVGVDSTRYGNKLNGDEKDIYVVTKDTYMVYYLKGFENNNFVYYKAIED